MCVFVYVSVCVCVLHIGIFAYSATYLIFIISERDIILDMWMAHFHCMNPCMFCGGQKVSLDQGSSKFEEKVF